MVPPDSTRSVSVALPRPCDNSGSALRSAPGTIRALATSEWNAAPDVPPVLPSNIQLMPGPRGRQAHHALADVLTAGGKPLANDARGWCILRTCT